MRVERSRKCTTHALINITCFDRTTPCVYIYVHIGDTMCISQLMGCNMAHFCVTVLHGKVVANACLVSPDDVVYPT